MKPLLPHESNLKTKINKNKGKGYKKESAFFQMFCEDTYQPWHERNMDLKSNTKEDVHNRVDWFEEYLKKIDDINNRGKPKGKSDGWIDARSKFKPSAYEQFVFYLLKDCPSVSELGLQFANRGIFAGLSIDSDGNVVIKTKDVDCAIGKKQRISMGEKEREITIPAVAIEVKTHIDKTMWSEAQFTAQLIKKGNPAGFAYVIAGWNQISIEELLPESPINEIFILQEKAESNIDKMAVYDFVMEIEEALHQIKIPKEKKPPGRLLHRN